MEYTPKQKFFQLLLKVYLCLLEEAGYCQCTKPIGELKLMSNYIVKDDNPDVGFQLTLGEVKDAEGNVIDNPQGLVTEILSTDEGVVQFIPGATDRNGTVKFGSPGVGNLNYKVTDANGTVLGSGSDGFTVTTGDPAAITSISAAFDGLTPVSETPAAPAPEPGPAPEAAPAPDTAPVTGADPGTTAPAELTSTTGSTESQSGPADGGPFSG